MRFNSIHRYYFVGFIIACYLLNQGYVSIFNVAQEMILLKLIYFVMTVVVLLWYWSRFKYYKNRYVVIKGDDLRIHIGDDEYVITNQELEGIFVLNHKTLFKIFCVIHIFTKENDYFYFTSNISQFNKLRQALLSCYSVKFHEREKTCSVNLVVNKENIYRLFWGDHREVYQLSEDDFLNEKPAHYI